MRRALGCVGGLHCTFGCAGDGKLGNFTGELYLGFLESVT